MNLHTVPSMLSGSPTNSVQTGPDGVVEIGLLLSTKRAEDLLRLARDRHESVGQVLRKMIERGLAESA